ncbi:hypothetical protein CDD81_3704 [Ophiocordyceps australis]|uniref:NWD NACHT-NTPase N-terminal domain-containing protein n=1 Tax=Ophiocordyceps australis TaxID=1399860 RepID=A0A2C5XDZ4_9HYPO|nr:hypothetical protein CDD81_3704 [Ophiocordyceps australis]
MERPQQEPPRVGSNALRKLVGRLRNTSSITSSSIASTTSTTSSIETQTRNEGRSEGYFFGVRRLKAKHMSQSLAAAMRSPRSCPSLPRCSLEHGRRSLQLWNEAYDALRDDAACTGLVVAYEKTVAQELPSSFGVAGGMGSGGGGGWSDEERLGLLAVVASSGLQRRRASKVSLADEAACRLLESARAAIEAVLPEYPAAVVAWSGLCTLTPLLLDPVLQHADMRAGIVHVVGRIRWYMALAHVVEPSSWTHKSDYLRHQDATRASLLGLYRAVLELEMNCVCAAASIWNMAAKNVIGWASLGELLEAICQADAHVAELVEHHCTPSTRARLARLVDSHEGEGSEGACKTASAADVAALPVVMKSMANESITKDCLY